MFLPLLKADAVNADIASMQIDPTIAKNVAYRMLKACFVTGGYQGTATTALTLPKNDLTLSQVNSWMWFSESTAMQSDTNDVLGSVNTNDKYTFLMGNDGNLYYTDGDNNDADKINIDADWLGSGEVDGTGHDMEVDCHSHPDWVKSAFGWLGVSDPVAVVCGFGYQMYQYANNDDLSKARNTPGTGLDKSCVTAGGAKSSSPTRFGVGKYNASAYLDQLFGNTPKLSVAAIQFAAAQARFQEQVSNGDCWQGTDSQGSSSVHQVQVALYGGDVSKGVETIPYMCNDGTDPVAAINAQNGLSQGAKDFNSYLHNQDTAGKIAICASSDYFPPPDGSNQIPYRSQYGGMYTASTQDACVAGINNQGNTEFCNAYASNNDLYKACLKGQDAPPPETCPGTSDPKIPGKDCPSNPNGSSTGTSPDCNAGMLGWILCPVVNDGFSFLQTAFQGLISTLFSYQGFAGDNADTIMKAWGNFVTIANIILVITFLIIIYSAATGGGDK